MQHDGCRQAPRAEAGALRPVSTLLCRVKRRLPVAVVNLYGTFDESSAVGGLLSLRERLAEQPMALVVDATHLSVLEPALSALLDLADDAARWPGARIAMCGAHPAVRSLLAQRWLPPDPAPAGSWSAGEPPRSAEPSWTAGEPAGPAGPPRPARALPRPASPDLPADRAGIDLFDRIEDAVAVALKSPVPARHSVRLAPDRYAPEQARQLVAEACRHWRVPRLSQLARVVVSELVTNGVVHARTPMELTVRLTGSDLYLSVRDGDPRLLMDPGGGVAADGHGYGRGLLLVDSLADGWGCAPTGEGKVVWARLAVPV
jgi:anti-sigma regulatory factor (Ser/Thr protein kinase)